VPLRNYSLTHSLLLLQNVDVIGTQTVRDPLKPNMPHPSATSTPGSISPFAIALCPCSQLKLTTQQLCSMCTTAAPVE